MKRFGVHVVTLFGLGVRALAVSAEQSMQACETIGSTCEAAEFEETSLLQQRSVAARDLIHASQPTVAPGNPGDPSKGVAFSGGGWLALADFTGATMGLLHVLDKDLGGGGLERLFKKFGSVTGTSGGAWFTTYLIYSSRFQRLVERGAKFPKFAKVIYNFGLQLRWFLSKLQTPGGPTAWQCLRLLKRSKSVLAALKQEEDNVTKPIAQSINETWDEEIADMKQFASETAADEHDEEEAMQAMKGAEVLKQSAPSASIFEMLGVSKSDAEEVKRYDGARDPTGLIASTLGIKWPDVVNHLLRTGGGIDRTVPLGTHEVNKWSLGKTSLMPTSAVAPPGVNSIRPEEPRRENVVVYNVSGQVVTYAAEIGGPFNLIQPVRFSVVVGAGESSRAPVSFCSGNNINCRTYMPVYKLNGTRVSNEKPERLADTYQQAFDYSAGKNPVGDAAAASSAYWGGDPVLRPEEIGPCEFAAMTVWSSRAGNGLTFQEAARFRTKLYDAKEIDEDLAYDFQNLNINPLIDGGYSGDVTGIISSMVSGNTEIVAFGADDFRTFDAQNPGNIAYLFWGSPRTGNVVFNSPSFTEVIEIRNALPRIPALKGAKFLKSIAYGTIPCVTARNDLFGVLPGRRVSLNIFAIETVNISIGVGPTSVFEYGVLVGEIVSALKASPQTAQILKQFFL